MNADAARSAGGWVGPGRGAAPPAPPQPYATRLPTRLLLLPTHNTIAAACDFAEPTCVIVKHTNPCGVASRGDLLEAYRLAVIADPISAFGGIVAFNRCARGHAAAAGALPLVPVLLFAALPPCIALQPRASG